jgi:hypothetical protein
VRNRKSLSVSVSAFRAHCTSLCALAASFMHVNALRPDNWGPTRAEILPSRNMTIKPRASYQETRLVTRTTNEHHVRESRLESMTAKMSAQRNMHSTQPCLRHPKVRPTLRTSVAVCRLTMRNVVTQRDWILPSGTACRFYRGQSHTQISASDEPVRIRSRLV